MRRYGGVLLLSMLFGIACKQDAYTARTKAIMYALQASQQILDSQVQKAWRRSEDFWIDPLYRTRGIIWFERTKRVKAVGIKAIAYLDSLQNELLVHHKKPADVLWPTKEDPVYRVYSRLEKYKDSMIAAIRPDEFYENPRLQGVLKTDIEIFRKTAPLLKPRNYNDKITGLLFEVSDWDNEHLRATTTEGAIVILDKLKNDVRMSMLMLIGYFSNHIGSSCGYSRTVPLIVSEYDTVSISQSNTIRAGFIYYDRYARPRFYIGDSLLLPNGYDEPVYRWKAPSQPGTHTLKLRYEYMMAENMLTGEKTITYEVAPR